MSGAWLTCRKQAAKPDYPESLLHAMVQARLKMDFHYAQTMALSPGMAVLRSGIFTRNSILCMRRNGTAHPLNHISRWQPPAGTGAPGKLPTAWAMVLNLPGIM